MSLVSALFAHLTGDAALSALIGTRCYPNRIPDADSQNPNDFPLVAYQLIDESAPTTYGGNAIFVARMQVDAWARSYKTAQAVADAAFSALQGYTGAMGDQSIQVGGVFRLAKRDLPEPDVELWRVSQDFRINWKE